MEIIFRLRAKDKCKECQAPVKITYVQVLKEQIKLWVKCDSLMEHEHEITRKRTGREDEEGELPPEGERVVASQTDAKEGAAGKEVSAEH